MHRAELTLQKASKLPLLGITSQPSPYVYFFIHQALLNAKTIITHLRFSNSVRTHNGCIIYLSMQN